MNTGDNDPRDPRNKTTKTCPDCGEPLYGTPSGAWVHHSTAQKECPDQKVPLLEAAVKQLNRWAKLSESLEINPSLVSSTRKLVNEINAYLDIN